MIVAEQPMKHLENHNLISFRTTADLLLLSQHWQDALNASQDTLVIALDFTGTFD